MPAISKRPTVPVAKPLDVQWIHGSVSSKHNTDPDLQVYWYDDDTVILRQNKAIDYEAPFLFLLFGERRAVLLDTGATASEQYFPLRAVVDGLLQEWLARHSGEDDYGLLVLHTHSHGDHVAGDPQFVDRANTVLVGADKETAWEYFGFTNDPEATQAIDLGGRAVTVFATPGHDAAAVTFYDPWTGILFTGDTLYRGRLYIVDWSAYSRSVDRLIEFCRTHPVTHVLGCHIEMTSKPGVDYPVMTTYQPDEPPLEMTAEHLLALRCALDDVGPVPALRAFADFILWPEDEE
ncbi:hydroxyacylglutathione hydrolase [Mycobacterium frederiksbergense]|uniref:Hydroxyacylglutathione hydrolase n=1 Tax=Mycolicibacterium frederiksbergense TaxID=117567 RepID=A0ABT6KTC2_9MYCO|nr:MBL fold metallo-hydrolase [Mycolicibacterium frederiksbergense]MDH6193978.1 hydroxyacylglutathione hydrolase [Mycolicibacterium frederiksbergense]